MGYNPYDATPSRSQCGNGVFDLRERVRTQEVVMWEPLLLP